MNELLKKYFDPATGTEEKKRLMLEISRDSALEKEFAKYSNIQALLMLNPLSGDGAEGRKAYNKFRRNKKQRSTRRFVRRFASCAAALALVITATWYVSRFVAQQHIYDEILAVNTISVPAGQRVLVKLNDGSEVWLNSKTVMEYPAAFNGSERRVKLDGEAHFYVASNPEVPFVVETHSLTVNVTGTTFNVSDYSSTEFAEVGLVEGGVRVALRDGKGVYDITPGRYLRYDGVRAVCGSIDPNEYLWTNGVYYFDNTPLSEITRKLEIYYDVRIDIQDPELGKRLYTGKFRQQDGVSEVLRIMCKTYPFKVERDDQNNLFVLKTSKK